jgi:hypothetical protein
MRPSMKHLSSRLDTFPPTSSALRVAWFTRVNVLACTCLMMLVPSRHAQAAARQWQAGARLGSAWLDGPGLGFSAETYLRHGLTDSFDLELQVLTSLHPFTPTSDAVPVGSAPSDLGWALGLGPGILYRWDVLRVVPFAGVGLGIYEWGGVDADLNRAQFGGSARLGLDYLLTRNVVLSVQTSAHAAWSDDGVRIPWFQLGLGAAHAWGW